MYARDIARIATPVGMIAVEGDMSAVHAIRIEAAGMVIPGITSPVLQAVEQLTQWFAGERMLFDLPLAPAVTLRGQALRDAMVEINYGDTLSYGTLARIAESSARAIGQACARNPFPIIVPCHRILNANGRLGAYSAGQGPTTKQWLLDHERNVQGLPAATRRTLAGPHQIDLFSQ